MSRSNYSEVKVLDHEFGGAAYTQPAAHYVKLHLGDPGEDCTANPATEVTRKVVTWNAASSPGGTKTSASQVQWTSYATISGGTETLTHFSIWDAVTSGNPLRSGALTTPVPIASGGTVTAAAGAITLTDD